MLSNCANSPPISSVDISVNKAWCNTRTKWNTIDYTWTINNYSLRTEKTGEALESPTFSDNINEYVKWKLQLYPKGLNEENKEFVSTYLTSCNNSELKAKYKISVSNNTTKSLNSMEYEYNFKPGFGRGSPNFIRQDTLFDALLPDDVLIISCIVSCLSESINISGPLDVGEIIVPQSKLIQNLGSLFDNGEFSDVTIAVGQREIRAHKAILSARSSYFAAMFKHETQENRLNRIVVIDFEHDVLKEMLNFIYTDKAPNLEQMAYKLLPAADKYDLEKLKAMCEESLRATMSIEDAIEALTLADRHSAVQLKSYAKEFIKLHISEIIETSGWQNLFTKHLQNMLPSIDPTKIEIIETNSWEICQPSIEPTKSDKEDKD